MVNNPPAKAGDARNAVSSRGSGRSPGGGRSPLPILCGDANRLTVSHCAHCSLRPGWASRELRGWKKTPGVAGTIDWFLCSNAAAVAAARAVTQHNTASLLPGAAGVAVDTLFSLLSWLTQPILPRCNTNAAAFYQASHVRTAQGNP